jgi:hypothetical protein
MPTFWCVRYNRLTEGARHLTRIMKVTDSVIGSSFLYNVLQYLYGLFHAKYLAEILTFPLPNNLTSDQIFRTQHPMCIGRHPTPA